MRALLRLEFLFNKADHNRAGDTQWEARASLESLFQLSEVAGRAELRTELTKELDRHAATLAPMKQRPGVDVQRLDEILTDLSNLSTALSATGSQSMGFIKDHEMLSALRQRSSIPGGSCAFDLPGFHRWLQMPSPERRRHVQEWFQVFEPVRLATETLMHLIRQSATASKEIAEGGFYQAELTPNRPYQLVRVRLPLSAPYFPEISGGRHRFTIRFLQQSDFAARPSQTSLDVDFELTRCVI